MTTIHAIVNITLFLIKHSLVSYNLKVNVVTPKQRQTYHQYRGDLIAVKVRGLIKH